MLSTRKGPFRAMSGEDITIVAEIKLPFRLVIVIVLAACEPMNFWEVSISLLRRFGVEFNFDTTTGYDDHLITSKNWHGSLVKPVPITPANRWHDDGTALWCSPFEPEDDDESNYDEDVIWEFPGRPDPEFNKGHPQRNAPDVLDQVAKVLKDLDDDKDLPF